MRTKKILVSLLAAIFLVVFTVSPMAVAFAYADDEGQEIAAEGVIADDITESGSGIEGIADSFLIYLKDRYGDNYQYYYDRIIDNWGSVEAYLLSFGDKLPEETRNGWQRFVGWLDEYASVWAPALAVAVIIIVALIGKKQFDALVIRIVNAKLKPIVNELNVQSKATVSLIHSQKALLGTNSKFTDTVKELDESEKEITNG